MSKSMLVALWLRNTYVTHQGADIKDRLAELRTALEKADQWRQAHRPAHRWAKPQMLFVAPEYLFGQAAGFALNKRDRLLSYTPATVPAGPAGPDTLTAQHRHMDEAVAMNLIKDLRTISAHYAKLLIVPGTIAWSKKFTELVKQDPDIGNRLLKRIVALHHRLQPQLPMNEPMAAVKPSGLMAGKTPLAPHVAPSYEQKIDALRGMHGLATKASQGPLSADEARILDAARLCKNTALVLQHGHTRFVYSKQGDFHEVLSSQDASRAYEVAIPGQKDGFFEIDGVRYGIEICFDHALGALKHPGRNPSKAQPPHIQIITSAAVEVDERQTVVSPNGYVVNASCDQETDPAANLSGLWRHDAAQGKLVKQPAALVMPDVAGYPLWLYEITLG
jgi:hypothetical protein